jgi:putative ABC transport system permease protein
VQTLWQDLRYALRMLAKAPGFAAVAILTLALGIGANTAIFSVIDSVLLKSLPYPQADRLVVLDEHELHAEENLSVAWPNFLDWRDQNRSFLAAAGYRQDHFSFSGPHEPVLLRGGQVTAPFFSLLGGKPLLGRTFTDAEDKPGANRTVVLGYSLWRNRLGGDPEILGKSVTLGDIPYAVIGVMPPDFRFFQQAEDFYIPLGLEGSNPGRTDRGNHEGIRVLARLRPGVSLAGARAEMDTIMRRLEQQYPKTNSGIRSSIMTLYETRYADVRPVLFTLLAAVGFVLLIACANVANLLLSRAAARQKEFAIRAAIGAGRLRVLRQLLTESVLLSFLGGALGLLVAFWAMDPLLRIAPQNIPGLAETKLNAGVALFTFVVSIFTGIIFGLAPALHASRQDLNSALKDGGHGATTGRSRQRLRAGLFVSEVSLALVLVIASGLLVRSLFKALGVNPGFNAGHVLALDVILPHAKYGTVEQDRTFFARALERIRALPGVRSASAALCPPIVGTCWESVYVVAGLPVPRQSELPTSVFNVAELEYFRTMEIPLIEGRYFTEADNADTPKVIVINQTLARQWWPHESALGKRIKQGWPQGRTPYREIVGVVGDLKQDGLDARQLPEVFLPAAQSPANSMTVVVRTATEPMSLAASVEKEIQAVDPDQPVARVQPMTQYMNESLERRRFSALLLAIFGALALLLAAIGIYSVMAYSVAQRTHEFGVRLALGAQPLDVLGLVVKNGLQLVLAGIGIGLVAAFGLTRLMNSLLFGVSEKDPVTFVGVTVLLCAVALAACYVPARRATRVDPMVALRHE